MSRAKHPEHLNAVQLFPFVAVLLCTMGSLLVILVGVARSSKVRAVETASAEQAAARAAAAPVDQSLINKISQVRQQIDRLKTHEGQANLQFQNEQLKLSHLEDHMRRLQDELESLRAAAAELNSLADSHFDDRKQGERELQRLNDLIAEHKQAIEDLRKEKGKRRTYAILPFKTPNGTRRPPVFFECLSTGIFLQPDGICFTEKDFFGPPGPSNPVAVAFRAAREQIVQSDKAAGSNDQSEPYALIIVRPGGQIANHLLQEVLDKSGIDFGYEIVESDAEITYPPADPQLLVAELQAVQTARGRLEMLAQAAPQLYAAEALHNRYQTQDDEDEDEEADDTLPTDEVVGGDKGKMPRGSQFAVDSNMNFPGGGGGGGVLSDGQNGGNVPGGPAYVAAVPSGGRPSQSRGNQSPDTQDTGTAIDSSGVAATDGGGAVESLPGATGSGGPMYRDGLIATQAVGNGTRSGSRVGSAVGTNPGKGNASGSVNANSNGNGGSEYGVEGGSGTAASGDRLAKGATPHLAAPSNGQSGSGEAAGETQFGNYDPHALPASAETREKLAPSGESYGRPMPGPVSDNAADRHVHEMERDDMPAQKKTKTKVRGTDWAIRSQTPGAVPIRRTIRVAVRGESLAILPEQGANDEASVGREVPLIGQTYLAREDFADAIEKHIHAWGMAGQGLYWKPVIELVVGPDGQHRADDLAELLKNSGIEVRNGSVARQDKGGASGTNR